MTKAVAHVHSMSVFDCPRIRYVREKDSGSLTIYLGRITIHVYGSDPYKEPPCIVELTDEQVQEENLQGYIAQIKETAHEELKRELVEAERTRLQADKEEQ